MLGALILVPVAAGLAAFLVRREFFLRCLLVAGAAAHLG